MDLACIGLTTLDILVRPVDALPLLEQAEMVEDISLAPAGTAGGTAAIAAKLGLDTALISAIGEDVNGRIVSLLLSDAGVDIEHLAKNPTMRTSTTVLPIRSDGERPNFHMLGASVMTTLTPEALAAARSAKVFHFAGVSFPMLSSDDTVQALASLQQAGVTVTCDLIAPQPNTLDVLKQFLPYIDVFMPSRAEVAVLLGDIAMQDALRQFVTMGAKHVFIKLGAEGVIGLIDGEITRFPAYKITPVDTTSCGDSFCAGLICGLVRDMNMKKAAECGIATASFVAQGAGTLGALKGIDQVLETMESI
ncbi:sugar kinase [Parasphingorhabdus sp.]|uniref:carbohydrate kinase family protein n=1 Tax=Parasphingorhabdus sp. TaxID=2709688 RepID=UPI003266C99D